jgi:hypothetical protein
MALLPASSTVTPRPDPLALPVTVQETVAVLVPEGAKLKLITLGGAAATVAVPITGICRSLITSTSSTAGPLAPMVKVTWLVPSPAVMVPPERVQT